MIAGPVEDLPTTREFLPSLQDPPELDLCLIEEGRVENRLVESWVFRSRIYSHVKIGVFASERNPFMNYTMA